MRTSEHILGVALLGLGLGLTTAHAFDGRKSPDSIPEIPGVGAVVRPPAQPDGGGSIQAMPLQPGNLAPALKALEDAFGKGDAVAGWKLGHMYADGVSVERNPLTAFHYFRRVVESKDNDQVPELRPIIADASVQLGLYYLKGIPNSDVKPDPVHAHKIFVYAALMLGDADAQYYLGRMYLEGYQGVNKEPKQAEKWLYHAATRGQYEAQVKYGSLLIEGKVLQRDVATGLMWLRVAVDTAPEGEAKDGVRGIYNAALEQATKDERAAAEVHYEQWKRSRPAAAVRP
ncbi:MAG: sel1 repeat family protein [Bradyrhizobiaceae bacterium]|nr:sel1 repeat family protein [Bradyrhizobiaceae bacterium]